MRILTITLAILLTACTGTEEDPIQEINEPVGNVWNKESERVWIVQDEAGGRTYYDYSRDMLTSDSLTVLYNLHTTEETTCGIDVPTYVVEITDGSGVADEYKSANADCGGEKPDGYLAVDDIEGLIEALEG